MVIAELHGDVIRITLDDGRFVYLSVEPCGTGSRLCVSVPGDVRIDRFNAEPYWKHKENVSTIWRYRQGC